MTTTDLRTESLDRVQVAIAAARVRTAGRRALDTEKRRRRAAGVDIRNRRKLARLETR